GNCPPRARQASPLRSPTRGRAREREEDPSSALCANRLDRRARQLLVDLPLEEGLSSGVVLLACDHLVNVALGDDAGTRVPPTLGQRLLVDRVLRQQRGGDVALHEVPGVAEDGDAALLDGEERRRVDVAAAHDVLLAGLLGDLLERDRALVSWLQVGERVRMRGDQ